MAVRDKTAQLCFVSPAVIATPVNDNDPEGFVSQTFRQCCVLAPGCGDVVVNQSDCAGAAVMLPALCIFRHLTTLNR